MTFPVRHWPPFSSESARVALHLLSNSAARSRDHLKPEAATAYFTNLAERNKRGEAKFITTNLPFKQWSTIFPGDACVVAMVDRFVQHCHVMDIEGQSWRPKDSEPPPKRTRPVPQALNKAGAAAIVATEVIGSHFLHATSVWLTV